MTFIWPVLLDQKRPCIIGILEYKVKSKWVYVSFLDFLFNLAAAFLVFFAATAAAGVIPANFFRGDRLAIAEKPAALRSFKLRALAVAMINLVGIGIMRNKVNTASFVLLGTGF